MCPQGIAAEFCAAMVMSMAINELCVWLEQLGQMMVQA